MKLSRTVLSINTQKSIPATGSWNNMHLRKRKGLHFSYDQIAMPSGVGFDHNKYEKPDRMLSNAELWEIYRRCSDVRASIDSIVRRVATFDWMVIPTISPQDERYEQIMSICHDVTSFLRAPNRNGDTWQELMTAMLTDCLCFDAGVIEIVKDRKGRLQELVPLRGSTIIPIIDEYGKLLEYEQDIYMEESNFFGMAADSGGNPTFKKDQIMYLSLFKNTATPEGNPLIESLINEVMTLIRSTQTASIFMDSDEIPPGILVLAGIAGRAAEEAKADLQTMKGQDSKIRVMTTPDPTGVGAQWLELKRTPREMMMKDIVDDIRRSVYRTFGVMPVEMGLTSDMPRATATVQMDVASSHLVTPILELLQARINSQIITQLVRNKDIRKLLTFKFDREAKLNPQDQENMARTHKMYIEQGVLTRNEVREVLGYSPVSGGDKLTVTTSGMPVFIDELGLADISDVQPPTTGADSELPKSEDIPDELPFTDDQ